MFASGDYALKQLLNAPILNNLSIQQQQFPSTTTLNGILTTAFPNSTINNNSSGQWNFPISQIDTSASSLDLLGTLFGDSNNTNKNFLLNDYSLTLQLLQLQLALQSQQQQNNNSLDNLLLAATAIFSNSPKQNNSNLENFLPVEKVKVKMN